MKFATMVFAGALALASSFAAAQAAGAGRGAVGTAGSARALGGPSSSVTAMPPAGNPPGTTTGQVRPGAMGNPNAPLNPSGNSLINMSPSGSTLDQTGTGTRR